MALLSPHEKGQRSSLQRALSQSQVLWEYRDESSPVCVLKLTRE